MSSTLQWRFHAAPGTLAVLGAFAQPTLPPQQSPVPAASVTTTQANTTPYRSALENYQPFADEKVLPWKQSNETVDRIGGWRAYAKEAHRSGRIAGASRLADQRPGVRAGTMGQP